MKTVTILASAVLVLVLAGCGGGGGGGGTPTRSTPPPETGAPPEQRPPSPASRVRIGINDDGVDWRHPAFAGKISFDGAVLAYHRPVLGSRAAAQFDCAFSCRYFEIDSGQDPDRQALLIKQIIDREGTPPGNNRWYVHDVSFTASGIDLGWFELPAFEARFDGARHGTAVASVALKQAANAQVVPLAMNFDQDEQWEADALLFLTVEAVENELGTAGADAFLANLQREYWESFDIVNASWGAGFDVADPAAINAIVDFLVAVDALWTRYPKLHDAWSQQDRPAAKRTLHVWANGNQGGDLALPLSFGAQLPRFYAELRSHTVAVAALNDDETALAIYSNPCGPLPSDWNSARHGRHFCLSAPGTHTVAIPGGGYEQARGTSFAAPYVSGVLAEMMAQFRGQLGNHELLLRLKRTADRSGVFADVTVYGAGVVDRDAALAPVGTRTVAGGGATAPLRASHLRLPAAYGDARRHLDGVEVASFDTLDAPFWTPADALVTAAPVALSALPDFEADVAVTAQACAPSAGFAPSSVCRRLAPESAFSALAAHDGAGFLWHVSPTWSVAMFSRAGRLDAAASGAFALSRGSSALWSTWSRDVSAGAWRLRGLTSLGLDAPYGPGTEQASMFEAGPAVLSSWRLAATRRDGDSSWTFSAAQPPRAESGEGTLSYAAGRRPGGERIWASRSFALTPSRRQVDIEVSHERPLGDGRFALSLKRSESPGHARGPAQHAFGAAWKFAF